MERPRSGLNPHASPPGEEAGARWGKLTGELVELNGHWRGSFEA